MSVLRADGNEMRDESRRKRKGQAKDKGSQGNFHLIRLAVLVHVCEIPRHAMFIVNFCSPT